MKLLEDENLDWAFLPIGDNYTMGADDAIKACGFINCKDVIGMHYDTFPVIKINKDEVMEKFDITHSWYLPVLDKSNKFTGFISKTKVFNKYREVLSQQGDLYEET